MALTIVVRSGDSDTPPKITFDAPRVVIGRGEGCEVRLPDPSVSHRHASVRQRGTEYIVVDEGSTNGTFVGQVLLTPQASRLLKSGDRIRVGRVWLEILIEQVPATQQPQLATKEIALSLVADALRAQGQEAELVIAVTEGPDTVADLRAHVAKEIGPIAKPRQIMIVAELPKTRSGKIMRRLLRDVAEHRAVGDVTTLADSTVMDLIKSGLGASPGSE